MGSVSIEKKQNHIHESGFAYDGFGHTGVVYNRITNGCYLRVGFKIGLIQE